jgi:hypothetical protein
MNKALTFWIACSLILFLLSLVWLDQGLHRRNSIFTAWLLASVSMQLIAAWGLALHRPWWFRLLGTASGVATAALAAGAVGLAVARWQCPINRVVLLGLGGMLVLQFGSRLLADPGAIRWTRNLGFFGPGLYMLICFSGLRLDRLPLWAADILRATQDCRWRAAAGWARALLG